jgi:molybdopterin-guanine dinucleotide biosynthesis protein B
MEPYVVKFVSIARGRGKTYIASQIVSKLKLKGYVVGVIKHVHGEIDVADKDSAVYRDSGADIVILSSERYGAVFMPKWIDDLKHVLSFVNTPIVVVEGFKNSEIGDTIIVAENVKEVEEVGRKIKNVIGAVVRERPVQELVGGAQTPQLFTFSESDVESLVKLIEIRALEFIENQTPKTNCGYCGFETCKAFAKVFAMGKADWCPVASNVKLVVDGKNIPLNPFVKNALRSTIEGFISSLKGVSEKRKKIFIEIDA